MADDKAAGPELPDQRCDGHQTEINADPGRIGVQFPDDQRCQHGRQDTPD